MSIDFRCPNGHKLSVSETLAGRKARCPLCKTKMFVPEDNSRPKQVARAAPETGAASIDFRAANPLAPSALRGGEEESFGGLDVYRPDAGKVQSVRLLALPLLLAATFATAPVWAEHSDLWSAPPWAKAALLIAVLQLAYAAWMAALPDFSTVWMCMAAFASAAALYALAMAAALFTPLDAPLFLELGDARQRVAAWCFAVLLLMSFLTFACGKLSGTWRRSHEFARPGERTQGKR